MSSIDADAIRKPRLPCINLGINCYMDRDDGSAASPGSSTSTVPHQSETQASEAPAQPACPPVPDWPAKDHWRPVQTIRLLWQEAVQILPAWQKRWKEMQSSRWELAQRVGARIDSCVHRGLATLPLPQVSCTRRSALRFHVDHFEWDALAALLSESKAAPLELLLEE